MSEEKTTYELLLEEALSFEELKNDALIVTVEFLVEKNAKMKAEVSSLKSNIDGIVSNYNRLSRNYIDVKLEKLTFTDKFNKIPNWIKRIFVAN